MRGKEQPEPDYEADMRLPEGKTCADCRHAIRCELFGFSQPERTSCDFHPNRFTEAERPKGEG